MSKKHVIAMDTHSQTTDICVKTRANGPGRWHHVKTTIPELAAVIEQVRGPRELVLEEGPLAGWLLRNLKARVAKAQACDPRRNALIAKDGDKDDPIDAGKLADLYLGGGASSGELGAGGAQGGGGFVSGACGPSGGAGHQVMRKVRACPRWRAPVGLGARRVARKEIMSADGSGKRGRGTMGWRT